jgi:hypothetical protein
MTDSATDTPFIPEDFGLITQSADGAGASSLLDSVYFNVEGDNPR